MGILILVLILVTREMEIRKMGIRKMRIRKMGILNLGTIRIQNDETVKCFKGFVSLWHFDLI